MTRLKTNSWGIWTNTDQVSFRQFPSFYNVLSSGSLDAIADPALLEERRVLPLAQAAGLLVRVSQLAAALGPRLDTLEINPFIVGAEGPVAADAVITLLPAGAPA